MGLFLLGAISAFLVRDFDEGLRKFWMDGLGFSVFPYVLFVMTLKYPGEWLDYCMVLGIPAVAIAAALKLKGWSRNLAVVGLLFVAGIYGIFVVGRHY